MTIKEYNRSVEEFADSVYRFILVNLKDEAWTNDVVQDSFENGQKVKGTSDFSLSIVRLGVTTRVGYQNFQIYATYYRTPLIQPGKSPGGYNLYPCEIGIAFTFND